LTALQSATNGLISGNESILAAAGSVGGIAAGALTGLNVSSLAAQVTACTQQGSLLNLSSVLGRIGNNLGSVNASANLVTIPGGNLFDLAAKSYGDATAWTTIAQANPSLGGDPQITGLTTLTIPTLKRSTGGVFGV
jgi:nucleoid-associated protein YgaU